MKISHTFYKDGPCRLPFPKKTTYKTIFLSVFLMHKWKSKRQTYRVFRKRSLRLESIMISSTTAHRGSIQPRDAHFANKEPPSVNAFWPVTMYDEDGFQVANPLNRFATGDREELKHNADGSLDLYPCIKATARI
jgi:hypothetical protein